MNFDLDGALRWLKPQKKQKPLVRRQEHELDWVDDAPAIGSPVLLDTTVYVDVLQGRSSTLLDRFITLRTCTHSAVAVSELTHAYGRLDPRDQRTAGVLKAIGRTLKDIPPHRLTAPDSMVWGSAGIVAGVLFRLGSFAAGLERKCLNDALIYLHARKLGTPVLTANLRDFDLLQQLVPGGRVLFYRNAS